MVRDRFLKVHFLALGKTGWGEVTLALRMASEAREAGHRCSFTAPEGLVDHVRQQGFETLSDPKGTGVEAIDALKIHAEGADLRVLVDLNLGGAAMLGRQLHPNQLLEGCPLAGIDTWHYRELGSHIDLVRGVRVPIEPIWRDLPNRIVPVPFVRPEAPLATNLLPRCTVGPAERQARRKELGLHGPTVLFCTSWWQHALLKKTPGVLELLGLYLQRLGATIVHVGPADLPWGSLPYRRLESLPVRRFEQTMAATDLVLSLNASATSNTTALQLGVPVMMAWSLWSARGAELSLKLGYPPSAELGAWTRRFPPPPRFAMWPMDWTDVLSTLLEGNPYRALLHPVDLLDERAFHSMATGLLLDPEVQRRTETARTAYLKTVAALPGPTARLERFSAPR